MKNNENPLRYIFEKHHEQALESYKQWWQDYIEEEKLNKKKKGRKKE